MIPVMVSYNRRNGIKLDYLATLGAAIENGKVVRVYPLVDKSEPIQQLKTERGYTHIVSMGDGITDKRMKELSDKFIWVCPKTGLAEDGDLVLGDDLSTLADILLNSGTMA